MADNTRNDSAEHEDYQRSGEGMPSARLKRSVKALPAPFHGNPKKPVRAGEPPVYRGRGTYTRAQDAVIMQMRAEGISYAEIAEELGRSKEAVRRRWRVLKGYV